MPRTVLETADKLDFPLLALPPDARFNRIIFELLTLIINHDYNSIKRADEIHKTLTKLVLDGGTFKEIASTLASLCHGEIIIKELSGRIRSLAQPDGKKPQHKSSNAENQVYNKQVQLSKEVIATITLNSWRENLEKEDIMAVDYAANIIAMTLLKTESVLEREKRFCNDFLNDLIHGRITSKNQAIQRGKYFGLALDIPYVVFIFSPDVTFFNEQAVLAHEKLEQVINAAFIKLGKKCIVWNSSRSTIVLCPIIPHPKTINKDTLYLAEEVKKDISKSLPQLTVTVGIGTYHPDLLAIKNSYQEACQAINTGRKVWGPNGIYHYNNLGIYHLLVKLSETDECLHFIENTLGQLCHYDKKKNGALLLTLEQLLNTDSLRQIAKQLYIHPKTVAFRKNRIEEITGMNLDNPEHRLTLTIALKLHRLMNKGRNNFEINNA